MTERYDATTAAARRLGATNDCAVRAVAIATDTPYERVHAMMAARGRKQGAGTPMRITWAVLEALGWRGTDETERWAGQRERSVHWRTSPGWCGQRETYVTTRQTGKVKTVITAERHLPDDAIFLVRTGGRTTAHILCVRDGTAHDWTQGRRNKVRNVFRLTRVRTPAPADAIGSGLDSWIG